MLKQNIFIVVVLLNFCFLKSAQFIIVGPFRQDQQTGRLIFELGGIPELEMRKLRRDVCIMRIDDLLIDSSSDEELFPLRREVTTQLFERRPQNVEIRNEFVRQERPQRPQRETLPCIEKPKPTQRQHCYKNNNRIDRPKHAQFNKRVQQPKPRHRRCG